MTVSELVAALAAAGHWVRGRPSKVVSDALRWEISNGRVIRTGRGRYRWVGAPRTTIRRITTFAARCQAWIVAVTRNREWPPPSLVNDPREERFPGPTPICYPWERLGWLWAM